MKFTFAAASMAALLAGFVMAGSAKAAPIPVANYSFETLPGGGLNVPCGGSCVYSAGLPIPGWNTTGTTGQWITGGYSGNPPAYDGNVLAYSNGGIISQDVASAVLGTTYTLQVEVLHRTDEPMAGVVQFEIGGSVVATAAGTDNGPGTWNNFTAVYTASAADAGKTVTILLSAAGNQGDFDYVQLNASTAAPEPASLALLGISLPILGLLRRRRR